MHVVGLMLASLALVVQSHGKVESTFDKQQDFGALRTYSWTVGHIAFDDEADRLIIAAFDEQMTGLGFTKVAAGADVALTYFTVASVYVDFKEVPRLKHAGGDPPPTRLRSTMAVVMRDRASSRELWTARTREYLDPDPAVLGETIRRVVARLFETYPERD